MMKYHLYLAVIIPIILVGCATDSSQVFLPGVRSGAEAPESVYVPALQADDMEDNIEDRTNVTKIPQSESTAENEKDTNPGTADADVLFVKAQLSQSGMWTFSVTVTHPDTGWENYADGWDVVMPDGTVAKSTVDSPFTRLLLHPHVEEQPFTRSQANIRIPSNVEQVTVRAHDLIDGFGGKEIVVDLTVEQGSYFEVQRN